MFTENNSESAGAWDNWKKMFDTIMPLRAQQQEIVLFLKTVSQGFLLSSILRSLPLFNLWASTWAFCNMIFSPNLWSATKISFFITLKSRLTQANGFNPLWGLWTLLRTWYTLWNFSPEDIMLSPQSLST